MNQKKRQELILASIMGLALILTVAYSQVSYASTSEEDEEATPPPEDTAPITTPPTEQLSLGSSVPSTPAAPAGDDFVRTRLQLFNVPPNSPNIIAWVNVPDQNATSVDTITSTELDASNNVTGDGIGEIFISLPNVTAQINQQIEGCALDIVDKVAQCDNAFTASTNASTPLQVMLSEGVPPQ